jgi:hypothetical protein
MCCVALGAFLLPGAPSSQGSGAGYLLPLESVKGKAVSQAATPYTPREGDLIFYDEHSLLWTLLFAFAGTGPPLHMGIVVTTSEGGLAVLEAGPDDTIWVKLLDVTPRLRQFRKDFGGTILIRRCKVTLSREESQALTRFAVAQKGKPYAVFRLLLQGTPWRARGILAPVLARTDLHRDSWICSELAVAAGTVAGLFDPKVVRSTVTFPYDVTDNHLHDLSAVWHDPLEWKPFLARKKMTAKGR